MSIRIVGFLRELLVRLGDFVSRRNKLDHGQATKAVIESGDYLPGIVRRKRK